MNKDNKEFIIFTPKEIKEQKIKKMNKYYTIWKNREKSNFSKNCKKST